MARETARMASFAVTHLPQTGYEKPDRAKASCRSVLVSESQCLRRVKLAVAGKVSKRSRWCQYGRHEVTTRGKRVDCWFVTLLLKTGCGFPQNIALLGAHFAINMGIKYKDQIHNSAGDFTVGISSLVCRSMKPISLRF